MLDFLKSLFPWFADREEEQALAQRIEAYARTLSGLPARPESAPAEVKALLISASLMLERLVKQEASRPSEKVETKVESAAVRDVGAGGPNGSDGADTGPEMELSRAAKELIKLRDWVLLAKSGDVASRASVLEGLYRKLGQVLQKEGVVALEEGGPFDEERQQIIETQTTSDPAQDNLVCDTVRPGYLFKGQLVRPQEVILYTYQN